MKRARVFVSMTSDSRVATALSWLRSVLLFKPLLYLHLVALGATSLLLAFWDRDGRFQHRVAGRCAKWTLATLGVPVMIEGLERINTRVPRLYVANHCSGLDSPILMRALPFEFRIVTRTPFLLIPFLGWYLYLSGQVALDRGDANANLRGLHRAIRLLRSGMPLVAFPEGGRSRTGEIGPFLAGIFYAAIKAGVEVVPLALVGTHKLLPVGSWHIRPCPVRILVGEPISTTAYHPRQMRDLASRAQRAVAELCACGDHLQHAEDGRRPSEVRATPEICESLRAQQDQS
ncbi:MAG TPA: lysophospholipid acyltransferase family protein [Terriglobales bacterium]|nr:lysophospholipid acyltransferase family protein [Terriglobales bacterium]